MSPLWEVDCAVAAAIQRAPAPTMTSEAAQRGPQGLGHATRLGQWQHAKAWHVTGSSSSHSSCVTECTCTSYAVGSCTARPTVSRACNQPAALAAARHTQSLAYDMQQQGLFQDLRAATLTGWYSNMSSRLMLPPDGCGVAGPFGEGLPRGLFLVLKRRDSLPPPLPEACLLKLSTCRAAA